MSLDSRRLMALEGVHTWSLAVINTTATLNDLRAREVDDISDVSKWPDAWQQTRRMFSYHRHFVLVAAHQLLDYGEWSISLGVLKPEAFAEFASHKDAIEMLRNKNEHVIEYFKGEGKYVDGWQWTDDDGTSDASSTTGTKIGGRLCWNELAAAAQALVGRLPPISSVWEAESYLRWP